MAAEPDPLRLVQMSLEAGAFGPLADRAIDQAINAGQLSGLLELIVAPPEGGQAGADMILARLIRPENLKGILHRRARGLAALDHLLPRLSVEGYEPLLEALGASPSRTVRRRLLDLLGRTQVDISPLVIARLTDERWYVQRNMLMLLARSRTSAGDVLRRPVDEASRRAGALRGAPPAADAAARARRWASSPSLTDRDPRIVHVGLTAIRDECPPQLVEYVIDLALAVGRRRGQPAAGRELARHGCVSMPCSTRCCSCRMAADRCSDDCVFRPRRRCSWP